MFMSLSDIGRILGLLPFSGVMFTVFCCRFVSVHFSVFASPILMPVSFSVWSSVEVVFPVDAISWSISCSVGMNGSLSCFLYFGACHFNPKYLRYCVYVITNCFFVLPFHCRFANVVLTSSGLLRLHSFAICFSIRILGIIVVSALPFFFSSIEYCRSLPSVSWFIGACISGLRACCRIPAALAAG
jgi:hypothetical protein